jgi:predicted RNA-binding Zn-ribbon protein involved in translation (DUF1610 family)
MTSVREYPAFGRKYLAINVLTMLPAVPLLIFLFWRGWAGIWDRWTLIAAGAFAVAAIAGLWSQHRRGSRFVCPECARLIVRSIGQREPGAPVDFLCEHCDIRWRTGLRVSEDG